MDVRVSHFGGLPSLGQPLRHEMCVSHMLAFGEPKKTIDSSGKSVLKLVKAMEQEYERSIFPSSMYESRKYHIV